ncbi:MAG TPA: ABC transporter ATP-binding protein, partial [Thermoanaerobaculia bacterium]|nr:ABC transporter ATP-binding protein [Thermoanaerobaculia bacterium]
MSKRKRSSVTETVWLWRAMKPVRPLFVHVLLALGVTSLLATLDPLVLKWLIDDVLPLRRVEVLPVVAAAYFLIYFFRLGLNGLSAMLTTYASHRVGFSIRHDLMRHLFAQSARYHAQRPVGEVMYRVEGDVTQSTEVAANLVTTLARVLVVTTLTVTIMLILNWRLSLFVFPLVPCVVLIRRYLQPRLRALSDEVQQMSGARNAMLQEQLSAVGQIQLLRREVSETRRFVRTSRELILLQVKRYGLELLIGLSAILVLAGAATVVIAYGGLQVIREAMTIGGFIAFYTYLTRLFDPI